MKFLMLSAIVAMLFSCGGTDSEYIDYRVPEGAETQTSPADENQEVPDQGENQSADATQKSCDPDPAEAFQAAIAPGINATCSESSCHGTAVPQFVLQPGKDEPNRRQMLKFSGGDASKLYAKVSNEVAHGGADQSNTLGLDQIDQWLDAEAACGDDDDL